MYLCYYSLVTVRSFVNYRQGWPQKLSTETSGHTLAATLGLLGIYQDEQDIVYQHIIEVIGLDRDPVIPH